MVNRRNKKTESTVSLKIAFLFCSFVILLVAISVLIKGYLVFSQSKFDDSHHFTFVFSPIENELSSANKQKTFEVVSFFPDNNSAFILNLSVNSKEREILKPSMIGQMLKIPVDGVISFNASAVDKYKNQNKKINFSGDNKNIDLSLQTLTLNPMDFKTDLTLVDLLRLWVFSKKISSQSVISKSLLIDDGEQNNLDKEKISSQFFIDDEILKEKATVQIINGTGVSGLGNRLAKLISNMGGNVVSVLTAEKDIDKSEIIYFGKKSYTLEKLGKVLGIEAVETKEQGISDIIIYLGTNKLPFQGF